MSKMISARVPDPLYDQVSACLSSLGATPSDLVNAAFEYVLNEHALPGAATQSCKKERKKLTAQQKRKLADVFRGCTLGIEMPNDASYAKQIAHEARADKHEDPARY